MFGHRIERDALQVFSAEIIHICGFPPDFEDKMLFFFSVRGFGHELVKLPETEILLLWLHSKCFEAHPHQTCPKWHPMGKALDVWGHKLWELRVNAFAIGVKMPKLLSSYPLYTRFHVSLQSNWDELSNDIQLDDDISNY